MGDTSEAANQAYITLVTNDRYAKGALVLGQSLRSSRTARKLVVLVAYTLGQQWRTALERTFDEVVEVNPLDSEDKAHLALMSRPELGVTFSKLHCWTLTHYSKCVFMDADTYVVENIDDLFERDELSAAPDVGWPDLFNTGVFVFVPSMETFNNLLKLAVEKGSFDGGDQGLLNTYFSNWARTDINKHLPFIYNMAANLTYSYLPALLHFGTQVKVVHFLGQTKPWDFDYNVESDVLFGGPDDTQSQAMLQNSTMFIKSWWKVYKLKVSPLFEMSDSDWKADVGFVPAPVNGVDSGSKACSGDGADDSGRTATSQSQWERGEVDYTGDDRFANIMRHLDAQINRNGVYY